MLLQSWKKRDCKIVLFGGLLDEAEVQKQYLEAGTDVIVTDKPDVLRQVMGPPKQLRVSHHSQ